MAEQLSTDALGALAVFRSGTAVRLTSAQRERMWTGAVAESKRPRPAVTLAVFLIAATAGAAAMLSLANRPREIQPFPGAQWTAAGSDVRVQRGQVRFEPRHHHLRVVTGQLEAELENARALVDATPGATALTAEEGDVVYRTRSGEWHLKPGERVTLSDAPQAVVAAAPAPVPSCAGNDVACLGRVSAGSGLAAQMALYKLAAAARERGAQGEAIEHLRAYQRRFDSGAFAPEVSIALMQSLRASGDLQAAAREAQVFLERFADDPRRAEVERWGTEAMTEESRL
jgi:TolA-binding protein